MGFDQLNVEVIAFNQSYFGVAYQSQQILFSELY